MIYIYISGRKQRIRLNVARAGVWNREELGPSDLYFIVCPGFIHSCYNSRTMIYLTTIYEVRFCIYLSYVCTYFTTLCLLFTKCFIQQLP